jgi:hypothetical protein
MVLSGEIFISMTSNSNILWYGDHQPQALSEAVLRLRLRVKTL